MSILVNRHTRVLCQGITGKVGLFHSQKCREYGTQMVGGVTPGKGGTQIDGFPVFNTVEEAVRKTEANATMIFVPPPFCADAILEAESAGIAVIIAITEGTPVLDMVRAQKAHPQPEPSDRAELSLESSRSASAKIGIMPGYIHKPGPGGADEPQRHVDV